MPRTLVIETAGAAIPAANGVAHPLDRVAPIRAVVEFEAEPRPQCRLLDLGPADRPDAPEPALRLPQAVLAPGLVNAHTHLDLTAIGPRPFDHDAGFTDWIDMVIRERPREPEQIQDAVRLGAELSLAGGVVAVGDIAGAPGGRPDLAAFHALAETALSGVSFIEFFAIGTGEQPSIDATRGAMGDVEPVGRVRPGLSPHASNTVSARAYEWAARFASERELPWATHLAETMHERMFVADATGPQRELLEKLGLWTDDLLADVGRGASPVDRLAPVLRDQCAAPHRPLLVHLNDLSDADIETLANLDIRIAYCPRSSSYFGAERTLGAHRYRDLQRAGIAVCLGTDSIVNLPEGSTRISTLDEARLLHERDALPAPLALAMATSIGAEALGLDPRAFTLAPETGPRSLAGLVAIDAGAETDARTLVRARGAAAAALSGGAPKLVEFSAPEEAANGSAS